MNTDTIAAIATAQGPAGIAVVRISGPDSAAILGRVFRRPSRQRLRARNVHYGHVHDFFTDEVVDEVVAWLQPGPYTYTRESMAEIHCHGGMAMPKRVLATVLAAGARIAEPGEFSLRAFLNGRLDLAQAESVLDIVTAKSDNAAKIALFGSDGRLSQAIHTIRGRIIDLLAHIAATIDFPEDDVPESSGYNQQLSLIRSIVGDIEILRESYRSGRRYRDGAKAAIVGRPNVGKSSLLNALARHERAIVSDVPGTTRDTIEESVDIHGVAFVLTDTAGIRESSDRIELLGIARAKESRDTADIILMVVDSALPLTETDRQIVRDLPATPSILVLNKSDLPTQLNTSDLERIRDSDKGRWTATVHVSSITHMGISVLESLMCDALQMQPNRVIDSVIVTNQRHFGELVRAADALTSLLDMSYGQIPTDVVVFSLQEAATALGNITGETVTDDVLASIFSRFCIGK